jgi:hypothetical protein
MRSRASVARRSNPNPSPQNDGFYPPEESPTAPSVTDAFERAAAVASDPPVEGEPRLEGGFDRIVSRLYSIDSDKEAIELEHSLKLSMKASRADYPIIVDALDLAEDNARRAMALFANAKVAHAAYEMDTLAITGAMRRDATKALEAGKVGENGKPIKGTKMITEADVVGYIASQWADQWRRMQLGLEKSKRMVDYLERLAELWKQRARDLGTMAQNVRQ